MKKIILLSIVLCSCAQRITTPPYLYHANLSTQIEIPDGEKEVQQIANDRKALKLLIIWVVGTGYLIHLDEQRQKH